MSDVAQTITAEDYHALSRAYEALEHPGYAARLSSLLGVPIERLFQLLPTAWQGRVQAAARGAIARAADVAVTSLGETPDRRAGTGGHRLLAIGSGALGGYFGLPGLIVELPVTTVLMLRSIADIARAEGEDPASPETRFACIAVFAFGGRSHDDDFAEIGYYEVRSALALHYANALERILQQGAGPGTLPATVQVIRFVARRFGLVMSDKAAAQLVPVVGAATGAVVNAIFISHFQSVARGHFTVRRLERRYGGDAVASAYAALARGEAAANGAAANGAAAARPATP